MRPKKCNPIGKPQKIIASPHLMAVLRRLDAKHARQSTPQNKENPTKGGNSAPPLNDMSHKRG